jgi:hypothetical protein
LRHRKIHVAQHCEVLGTTHETFGQLFCFEHASDNSSVVAGWSNCVWCA